MCGKRNRNNVIKGKQNSLESMSKKKTKTNNNNSQRLKDKTTNHETAVRNTNNTPHEQHT
jgi:hypothetical protein